MDRPAQPRTVAALDAVGVRRFTTGPVILDRIDWTVRSGEHGALLGANGAGKTTVLRLVGALVHPTDGPGRGRPDRRLAHHVLRPPDRGRPPRRPLGGPVRPRATATGRRGALTTGPC